MDYNQDIAINRLHVLDDTNVTCDKNACAIFNGGIYVEKDIYAANINIRNFQNKYINSTRGDISFCIFESVDVSTGKFNEINVNQGIYPSDIFTTATLGSNTKKWNSVYATNGNFQVTNSNTCNLKNLKYENLVIVPCIQNITSNFNPQNDWVLQLDKDIILINIYDIPTYTSNSLITIKIPETNVYYEHHKIILTQINLTKYKICWSIPDNPNFISDNSIQSFEIINLPNSKWKLIKYLQENTSYQQVITFPESDSESESNSDSNSDSESETNCNTQQNITCVNTCKSGCCVKKTFIKYVYTHKDIIEQKTIDDITNTIYDISSTLIQQEQQIALLNKKLISPGIIDAIGRKIDSMTNKILTLETQFTDIDSECRIQARRIDDLQCNTHTNTNTKTSHSHHNYNNTRLAEAIEDLAKIVRKNDKKMEELEIKVSNANSKMKKIIKYLNLD